MSPPKVTAIKGMSDILPAESAEWQAVLSTARDLLKTFGFTEMITPIVEPTELFLRSVGETSSIVEKEMYTFPDKKGFSLTLRPEGTAPVVRAYVESGLAMKEPLAKFWYFGPMFRYEQPQKGRSRQFYQLGVELIGAPEAAADAEVMILLMRLLKGFGIEDGRLEINSLGCPECRPAYVKKIGSLLKSVEKKLCEDCQRRAQKNPLRVFDCKNETCHQELARAPMVSEYWCAACKEHFQMVLSLLQSAGVRYQENPRIVRGLDYYCRTAFEVLCDRLGSHDAVAAGGRYDGLVRDLGGPDLPGVGFAIGMERVMLAKRGTRGEGREMKDEGRRTEIFFALLGLEAQKVALPLMQQLREKGKTVEMGYGGSLKSQLRRAQKLGAAQVVILGEEEIKKKIGIVKNMETGEQKEVSWGSFALDELGLRMTPRG